MSTPLDWNISQCDCGDFVLEWGQTSVHLSAADVARLHRLTAAAMEAFSIPESTSEVGRLSPTPNVH